MLFLIRHVTQIYIGQTEAELPSAYTPALSNMSLAFQPLPLFITVPGYTNWTTSRDTALVVFGSSLAHNRLLISSLAQSKNNQYTCRSYKERYTIVIGSFRIVGYDNA